MSLVDTLNESAKQGVIQTVTNTLPDSQLSDYKDENLEKVIEVDPLGNLQLYKWSNDKHTLFLLHKSKSVLTDGLTVAVMTGDKARKLGKALVSATGEEQ